MILGVPPTVRSLHARVCDFSKVVLSACFVGHQAPAVLVQRVLRLHEKGYFPLEAMIRTYALEDINKAVDDARSGAAVKPVLLH